MVEPPLAPLLKIGGEKLFEGSDQQHSGPAKVKDILVPKAKAQALKDKSNFAIVKTGAASVPTARNCLMDDTEDGPALLAKVPMILSNCFSSPIRTLKESIPDHEHDCITIHDLIEAYNALSNAIRGQLHQISSSGRSSSLLVPFKTNSCEIIDCLIRDIRRILPNPFDSPRQPHSVADLSFGYEISLTEEEYQIMVDDTTLCQYALRFACDILTVPAVYANFTDIHLTTLLRTILSFCTTSAPTTLNLPKLRAMAVWTLKVQQLSTSLLVSLKTEIVSALQTTISRQSNDNTAKNDAFKAIHCILNSHPPFMPSLLELLPLVLQHLVCDSPETQLCAALALSGFATVKYGDLSGTLFPLKQASDLVKAFIADQVSKPGSSQTAGSLASVLNSALEDGIEWRKRGPSFVLTVISCFLILLDHLFFKHGRSVTIIMDTLLQCANHKQKSVKRLQPEVWKVLFWAFHRVPLPLEAPASDGAPGIRELAFRVVCEDLREDRRMSLIGVLLRRDESRAPTRSKLDIKRAIQVTDDMFKTGSVDQATSVLTRLLANIGSRKAESRQRGGRECFSKAVLDGTLLSQTTRELSVPALTTSMDELDALSEEEVLENWESLSSLWASMVQSGLNCSRELTPDLVKIWQALLLVRAEPAEGGQTLSASPAFYQHVASIIVGFQIELDTAERQRLYLSSVLKLWSVLKNVFSHTSLSHPAEKLLASLLRTQFLLADDLVKESWSQLCGDLISVGVPTLLHVLRVRSEKQEGAEVTRQLWFLLAMNGPLTGEHEHWEDLLQFLLMPFSVWEMSSQEFNIWTTIFKRACDLAEKASKAVHHVVSHFLGLFQDVKLASLKSCSRTLYWILSQLTASKGYSIDSSLLAMINDCISSSYASSVEVKVHTLDILRLVGGLIQTMSPSDIVEFLSALQKGLSFWIADEKMFLEHHEDKELVDILYKPGLQLLAQVEPSIDVLESVATFIHSVFIRIRGDGPLAFHNFWRATYHNREGISKDDLPLPIQLCLKAWSDITAESLADDVSLYSGSQSLRSHVIPSSQSLEGLDSIEAGHSFDPSYVGSDHEKPLHVTAYNYSRDLDFHLQAPQSVERINDSDLPQAREVAKAGAASENASSGDNEDKSSSSGQTSIADPVTLPQLFASITKRHADDELPRTPKRRRIDTSSNTSKGWPRNIWHESNNPDLRPGPSHTVNREPSPFSSPSSSAKRKQRGGNEDPSWTEGNAKGFRLLRRDPPEVGMASSDDVDYDSWEQGISVDDLRQAQMELQERSDIVPDSEENLGYDLNTEPATEPDDSDGHDILSPSLGDEPMRSKQRQRSQTAPELSPASHSMSAAQPLRRNQTTPLERHKSSAQLEALQQAYAIVADTGTSQIDFQDIMQARRLANQINQILDEQMFSKVAAVKRPPND